VRALRLVVGLLLFLERAWKHLMVVRFFRRPLPPAGPDPTLISILQPILGGDPMLGTCLERNLGARSRHAREFIWLLDADDAAARRVCAEVAARYPAANVRTLLLPPPPTHHNPKMVKLVVGAEHASGAVLCVLDDDTVLPHDAFDMCLPYLAEPGAGLAFGLPYYVSFGNLWSALVSAFVDSHGLLTYIPYTTVAEPFTVNGMFYVVRRAILDGVGGFRGLEGWLADDFAVAQRFRAHGYRLIQTPLRHAISTTVPGPRQYLGLIQRWFIFPRESLLRHLRGRDRAVLIGMGLAPVPVPLLLGCSLAVRRTRGMALFTCCYFGYDWAISAHLSSIYLNGALPWRWSWCVPLLKVVFPLQLLAALLAPQRIRWRGHLMEAQPGGSVRIVERRAGDP
jgi:ceramide glucosyltransferase